MIPESEVLVLSNVSALNKLLTWDFKRRDHMEEQKAQFDNRFLKRRQIASMIFDHFKISGTREGRLDYKDHWRLQLEGEVVQGLDMVKVPDDDVL